VKRLCADITLAKEALGFSPKYSIEDGLKEFVEWYRQGKYEEWTAYQSEGES
jgi:nucleoside-diphosphate-sugar epimerase